ncbi:MAG: bifunctional aldolase/short-chain dehydrogenase [SAR324 cluster bacterium]|nr:bifunctional aldolase/short-chain dehydrogenase [SAR324 cluster bacterium]
MDSLWNDQEAKDFLNDPLQLRVYTSRLLGRESALVLHGGGNTSVKIKECNLFGDTEEILYIKGSGCDLATIELDGFAPVKLEVLQRMVDLEQLSDADMLTTQRTAMLNPYAPNPSVESIMHAILPFKYVDHTHADAVLTLNNTKHGESLIHDIYGDRVIIVPYVKPGFVLAKKVHQMIQNVDWAEIEGIILMHHGIFTFADDARDSYERMVYLASKAEAYFFKEGAWDVGASAEAGEDLPKLALLRKEISKAHGAPVLARWDNRPEVCGFANLPNLASVACRGPLTPDHVIRSKHIPLLTGENPEEDVAQYVQDYREYFERHKTGSLTCLNPAPLWAIWPGYGSVAFGTELSAATIITDIAWHSMLAIQRGEALGGWQPLAEKEIFEVEYWKLEQAKLKKDYRKSDFQGKIALVTGAANGIGEATAKALHAQGAAVVALDINPQVKEIFNQADQVGMICDLMNFEAVKEAVDSTVRLFGGLDILISNAGIFPKSMRIEEMDQSLWNRSIDINLSSHQRLLQSCLPYLKKGIDPSVIFIASKNVAAPGPGASAYSVAKAGVTQLARVAALELGPSGIRVNIIHPDAVFDTALWTEEILTARAKHYKMTVQEYKTKNLLRVEISSKDIANLACVMAGPVFAKTTGAQVPIDGGNDRVI